MRTQVRTNNTRLQDFRNLALQLLISRVGLAERRNDLHFHQPLLQLSSLLLKLARLQFRRVRRLGNSLRCHLAILLRPLLHDVFSDLVQRNRRSISLTRTSFTQHKIKARKRVRLQRVLNRLYALQGVTQVAAILAGQFSIVADALIPFERIAVLGLLVLNLAREDADIPLHGARNVLPKLFRVRAKTLRRLVLAIAATVLVGLPFVVVVRGAR